MIANIKKRDPNELPVDPLSLLEAAEIADVHASTIWRWVRSGAIAGWMQAGRVIVSEKELRAEIARRGVVLRIEPRSFFHAKQS